MAEAHTAATLPCLAPCCRSPPRPLSLSLFIQPAPSPCCPPPLAALQITAPSEFQGNIIGDVNRRKGIIMGSEQEGDDVVIQVGGGRSRISGKSGMGVEVGGVAKGLGPSSC